MGEGPGGDLRGSRATTHPRRPRASLSSQLPSVPFRGHDGSVPVHQGEPLGGAQSRVLSIPSLLPTPSRSPVGVAGLPWTDRPAWDQVTDLPLPHRQQPGEPLRRRQAPCHGGPGGKAAWRPPLPERLLLPSPALSYAAGLWARIQSATSSTTSRATCFTSVVYSSGVAVPSPGAKR